jgi:hypothetical protein
MSAKTKLKKKLKKKSKKDLIKKLIKRKLAGEIDVQQNMARDGLVSFQGKSARDVMMMQRQLGGVTTQNTSPFMHPFFNAKEKADTAQTAVTDYRRMMEEQKN